MNFSEIIKGGVYSQETVRKNNRTVNVKTTTCKVYVLEKDEVSQKVLASIGKLPPMWYNKAKYKAWK